MFSLKAEGAKSRNHLLARWTFLLGGLALVVLLGVAAACGGGRASPGPRLSFDGDTFELGEFKAGAAVQRLVPFQNRGDAPLTVAIKKVRAAPESQCGCGIESYSVDQQAVAPGKKANLVFKLNVMEGTREMKDVMIVYLQTNDPENGQYQIKVKYHVISGKT